MPITTPTLVPRLLEAFWSEAHTGWIQVGASSKCYDTGDGCAGPELHAPSSSFTVCFAGPSRSGPKVEQRARTVTFRASSGQFGADAFLTGEDVVQVGGSQTWVMSHPLPCFLRLPSRPAPTCSYPASSTLSKSFNTRTPWSRPR